MQSKIGQTTKQEIIFSCHLGLIKLLEAKLVNYFFFKFFLKKRGKLLASHRYNCLPLLPSGPGGVQQELVVQDLPRTKVILKNKLVKC